MVRLESFHAITKNTFLSDDAPAKSPRRALSEQPRQRGCTKAAEAAEEIEVLHAVAALQGLWKDRRERHLMYEVRGLKCNRILLLDGSKSEVPLLSTRGLVLRGANTMVTFNIREQLDDDEVVWRVASGHRRRGQARVYTWTRVQVDQ
mmetsp:Transcript_74504/g.198729  ORF Transcript_74504/g.198729 Transcript_74504/m.198729 type:complete len:148 (-) Transcript_74504:12-455(-)